MENKYSKMKENIFTLVLLKLSFQAEKEVGLEKGRNPGQQMMAPESHKI